MITNSNKKEIKVNFNTNNPDLAWDILSNETKKISCDRLKTDLPIYPDKVSIIPKNIGLKIKLKTR